jgi:hypothetical protein
MDTSELLKIGGLLGLGALLWAGFIRRSPECTGTATVHRKSYQKPGTYIQQPVGVNRGLRPPTFVPIAEAYSFELKLDDVAEPVHASFNAVKGQAFEVGQRVRVRYVRHGFPPLWSSIAVTDIFPVESP